jgi:hypothetical protein
MATRQMTMEELLELPVSFSVRKAAAALGIGQGEAYRMAAADCAAPESEPKEFPIPVRRYGREFRCTRPELFRFLGLPPGTVQAPAPQAKAAPDAAA